MEDLLKNKLFIIVCVFLMFNLVVVVGGKLLVQKAADEVIERLERNYSPSPYGPGLDPDRVPTDQSAAAKTYLEMKESQNPLPTAFQESEIMEIAYANEWRDQWERERGFNH